MPVKEFDIRGSHRELFSARDDEVLLCGPAGTGKSYACLSLAHLYCLRNPGVRVLFVRKTLESLKMSGLGDYRDIVEDLLETKDIIEYGGSTLKPSEFIYSNGSTIRAEGMDKPSKILSSQYDLIYVQEANQLTLEDWDLLGTRVRNGMSTRQQIIADCNPDTPTHWLKVRAENGKLRLINSTHEDNPKFYDADKQEWTEQGIAYMKRLDGLTGVRYLRYRKGIWAAAEGLIYENFDPAVHVLPEDFKIPRHWRRWWSIDFGFNNPFVCQLWAEDEDGRLYLYKEIYKTKRIVEDHARFLMNSLKSKNTGEWLDVRPQAIVADHDAEGRMTFQKHTGLVIKAADKKVLEGIEEVETRIKIQADGKPRIFFLRNAVMERDLELEQSGKPCSTLEEITGYVWDKNGERVKGKPEKEAPLKENDHGMDAMRYMCMKLKARGNGPRLRWLG